ncbi:shikimate dehydrogenase [Enterobacteriaceae endosymbiont of Macroplea mutica]|uniref:shikimate dehydrogenase n=1 Tax=Enterobacteriaceae endosymbiont of Macroplea mutica TaxID=2675791 RepID=UPI001448EAAB|nr:shikimate dehydrogenase [Enterobacteriaceae endosymbiont of Macroplea mutica]QJC31273.1 shikimate dehydrogenase [Enterobacteriaceae endosymbiont of Macroplea mutica]
MKQLAVFGNPVHHSKSPIIHKLFAQQLNIKQNYQKIYVPLNNFNDIIFHFFKNGGYGANITVPFKQHAYHICDILTKRAQKCGVVNTLKMISSKILGDNTDGIGLYTDLINQRFLHPNSNILILGAGGAVKGILELLLQNNHFITIVNRNYLNACNLVKNFHNRKQLSCIKQEDLPNIYLNNKKYDLIINATSTSMKNKLFHLPKNIIHSDIFCYDLFYSTKLTTFLQWCNINGAKNISDGIGMLIEQAAHSFYLWHGVMPLTTDIIKTFKQIYINNG